MIRMTVCEVCTYPQCVWEWLPAWERSVSGGTKGNVWLYRMLEIMIHQPSGGAQGQATEIEIAVRTYS